MLARMRTGKAQGLARPQCTAVVAVLSVADTEGSRVCRWPPGPVFAPSGFSGSGKHCFLPANLAGDEGCATEDTDTLAKRHTVCYSTSHVQSGDHSMTWVGSC
jgi:hypothetical protein